MSENRHVWHGTNIEVAIFEEDDNGNPIGMSNPEMYDPSTDTPILTYCFWQNVTINGELEMTRRPVTARPFKSIVTQEYEYDAQVRHFYFKKSEINRTKIFNRDAPLRIVMRAYDPSMIPAAGESIDENHVLKHARAKSFTVESQENEIAEANASFWAEEFTL